MLRYTRQTYLLPSYAKCLMWDEMFIRHLISDLLLGTTVKES